MAEPYSADYWRSRAAEMRAIIAKAEDPEVKSILLEIGKDYDRLAELARVDEVQARRP